MSTKRKASAEAAEDSDKLVVMPLGAGREVGRSCVLVKFKGKSILFDCGVHPAYTGLQSLPYFDEIDPESVDLLLISHFHLDHAAALPYFLEQTSFKGRVFMTHPTKAIYRLVLSDYARVTGNSKNSLFDESDLTKSMEKIEVINYHQELAHNGIRFTCYNAGHVLGAAMFLVDIAGVRVLYTGDFSREKDRHLMGAETPHIHPDIVISESTYGVQVHEPREVRERRFTQIVHNIVKRGGRCLLPVFALGRAQELLLILDEYWAAHPDLHGVPIYYASSLAKKCMTVYQTFVNMMNDSIRKRFGVANPFVFKYISALKGLSEFEDTGPCVVMASPGMLQSGLSRDLFDLWCTNKQNGLIIPGYCVEGTLAKHVMSEPKQVTLSNGETVDLKMSVDYISFSAHSDYMGTGEFIKTIKPNNVVLVHGEENEMKRLSRALTDRFKEHGMIVSTPKNCEPVEMSFRGDKMAKAIGRIAVRAPRVGERVDGLLVRKDFGYTLLNPADLSKFTHLSRTELTQRLNIPMKVPDFFNQVERRLRMMFSSVTVIEPEEDEDEDEDGEGEGEGEAVKSVKGSTSNDDRVLIVHEAIAVRSEGGCLILEWDGSPYHDMLADIVVACCISTELAGNSIAFNNMNMASESGAKAKSGAAKRGSQRGKGKGKDVKDEHEHEHPSGLPWTDRDVLHLLMNDHKSVLSQHYYDVNEDKGGSLLTFRIDGDQKDEKDEDKKDMGKVSVSVTDSGTSIEIESDVDACMAEFKAHAEAIIRTTDETVKPISLPNAHSHTHTHGGAGAGDQLTRANWIEGLRLPTDHSCC